MLETTLDLLFREYQVKREPLNTEFDRDWPSPCEIGQPFPSPGLRQKIRWEPFRRSPLTDDFTGLETALDCTIHPDIKTYYGRFWSLNLQLIAPEGPLELLFLWNQFDSDRLIENLIGHALACKESKSEFSVFFSCTEPDSEFFVTVNNKTGAVQLELPGSKPIRQLANSLNEFLSTLRID